MRAAGEVRGREWRKVTGRNLRREAGSGKGVGGGCQTPERGQRGGHRGSFFPRRPFPRQRGGPDAHSREDPGRRLRGPYSLRTLPRIVRPAQGAGGSAAGAGAVRRAAPEGLLPRAAYPPLKTPAAHAGEARAVRPRGGGAGASRGPARGARAAHWPRPMARRRCPDHGPPPAPAPVPPRPAHPASSPRSCGSCL